MISGIKNLIKYFKIVWNHKDWDYLDNLKMIKFQLESLSNTIQLDSENRMKIERSIELLGYIINDDYHERCGFVHNEITFVGIGKPNEKGEYHAYKIDDNLVKEINDKNTKAVKDSIELRNKETNELFNLLKNFPEWWD